MPARNNTPRVSSARPQSGNDEAPGQSGRRPYRSPVLTRFGDVRGLTLGGSPGIDDSGNPNQEALRMGGP